MTDTDYIIQVMTGRLRDFVKDEIAKQLGDREERSSGLATCMKSSGGNTIQVVIPSRVRKDLNLEPRDVVEITVRKMGYKREYTHQVENFKGKNDQADSENK